MRSSPSTFGAIVMATGFDVWDQSKLGEYGGGQVSRRHLRPPVRAAGERLGADERQGPAALRPHGAQDGGLRRLRGVAGPGARPPVLLQGLLHVHRQARPAPEGEGARRQGLHLLHGHPGQRQGLRGVRAAGGGAIRRHLHAGPGLPDLPAGRPAGGAGGGHAPGEAGGGAGGYGGAGHGHGAARGRQGDGPQAGHLHRPGPLVLRGAPEAAAGGGPHRRRLPGRGVPVSQGHPGHGGPGLRRRRQGGGPLLQAASPVRADDRRRGRAATAWPASSARRSARSPPSRRPRPWTRRPEAAAGGEGQRRPLPRLRHLRRGLPVGLHPAAGIQRRPDPPADRVAGAGPQPGKGA